MNAGDIAEMFIRAAETEAKLPEVKGLRESYGRYCLPWSHDLADVNSRRRTGDRREQLAPGDDPLRDWEMEWLTEWAKRATKAQIAHWEACLRITSEFLTDAGQRRALWAWALSQTGNLFVSRPGKSRKKISFARWCRDVENVAENTGHRRKNRALAAIAQGYSGKVDLHGENQQFGVLPDAPENEHIFATVEGQRGTYDTQRVQSWRDDPSFERNTGMTMKEWRAAKRKALRDHRNKAA